jgi:probable phosphoglycerate mutase
MSSKIEPGIDPSNYCTLYIVRHGETEWNAKGILMGQKDSPLTQKGIEQATELAERLRDVRFDAIFASDLPRAQATADIVRHGRNLPIQTSMLLRERAFGRFEGTPADSYYDQLKDVLTKEHHLSIDDRFQFKIEDDMESDKEIFDRFVVPVRNIAKEHIGKTVLVVTHGGCIRAFLIHTGYYDLKDMIGGSVGNAAHVKTLSNGSEEFLIQEVVGVVLRRVGSE